MPSGLLVRTGRFERPALARGAPLGRQRGRGRGAVLLAGDGAWADADGHAERAARGRGRGGLRDGVSVDCRLCAVRA